jgi:hypothetical protein
MEYTCIYLPWNIHVFTYYGIYMYLLTMEYTCIYRRSRKGDDDPLSTEISRQNTKDIDVHDIPDEELY